MRQTDTISNANSDRVVGRTPRAASTAMTAQAPSASGYQSALAATPVVARKARPKTATPMTETGGNTRSVPSSAHPARNPGRGPSVLPTNPYTEPAWLNSPASRTNPYATRPTPRAATANASGAALPSAAAAATPVTDMASVGAMTPTETDVVSKKCSSRCSAGRRAGPSERG